ncbi:MAG: hypothetical protein IID44_05440 [Planctomycetes bacterium]|nr:hypothetical protein [Planctomycetota bacterium]
MLVRIWGTLAVAVMALGLAGCGDDKSGGGKPAGGASGGGGNKPQQQEEIAEGDWGNLRIKFVYGGTPPAAKKIDLAGKTDAEYCGQHSPSVETLLVGPNGELENVVVYLRPSDAPLHESYKAQEGKEVTLTNKGCRFEPHVRTLWTKYKLKIVNADERGHNTNAVFFANDDFNTQIPAGEFLIKELPKNENLPMPISCGAHKWMKGHLLVRDNPYMGVSGSDGVLTIKDLPSGNWNFIVWHEGVGRVGEAKVKGALVFWKKGVANFAINKGDNDLGTFEIAAGQFTK